MWHQSWGSQSNECFLFKLFSINLLSIRLCSTESPEAPWVTVWKHLPYTVFTSREETSCEQTKSSEEVKPQVSMHAWHFASLVDTVGWVSLNSPWNHYLPEPEWTLGFSLSFTTASRNPRKQDQEWAWSKSLPESKQWRRVLLCTQLSSIYSKLPIPTMPEEAVGQLHTHVFLLSEDPCLLGQHKDQ